MAAPLFALGAWGRRPAWLVGLALLPLVYWQWVAPVRDLTEAVGEPSVEEAYYEPLLDELERHAPNEPFRVQIPPTRNRWEATSSAERYPLARGWLRQAESDDFELFQDGNLTPEAYREWLDERGVAFVALSARRRARLPRRGRDRPRPRGPSVSCEEVWSNEDWELYEVAEPAPIGPPPSSSPRPASTVEAEAPRRLPGRGPVLALLPRGRGRRLRFRARRLDGCAPANDGPVRVEADFDARRARRAMTGDDEICSA